MDPASPAALRLRQLVDRLLESTDIDALDRACLDEAKEILAPPAAPPGITIRHDPSTMPEPVVVTLRMQEGDR